EQGSDPKGGRRPFLSASFAGIQKSAATQNHVFCLAIFGIEMSRFQYRHLFYNEAAACLRLK
ncbi:MAG: hypothetical protein K1W05_07830, partial [Desulfovibrio sp.]